MRHLSHTVPKIAGQAFARKYIMLGRLVTQWADIVGPELAAKAQPVGTQYRKDSRTGKPFITLEIACGSADSTLLHYRKDRILQCVNLIFGDDWISDIRFVPTSLRETPNIRNLKRPLQPDEQENLAAMLDPVADAALQERLAALGAAVLQEQARPLAPALTHGARPVRHLGKVQ